MQLLTLVCVNGFGLGFIWILYCLFFFFLVTLFLSKFSVYLLASVSKNATVHKPSTVNSKIFFPLAEKKLITRSKVYKKCYQSVVVSVGFCDNLANLAFLETDYVLCVSIFFKPLWEILLLTASLRQWLGLGLIGKLL